MDKTKNYHSVKKAMFNRKIATEYRGKTYKYAAGFPSTTAIDTKENYENGNFDQSTNFLAIEKVKSRRKYIKRKLNPMTNNFKIAGTEAYSLNLNKYFPDNKIDYYGFDICGNFTAKIAGWFFDNQHKFADGMRMPMTLKAVDRKQKLYDAVIKETNNKYLEKVKKMLKKTLWSGIGAFNLNEDMIKNISTQIFMVDCSMPSKRIEIKNVNIYRNDDKNNMADDMITLDVYVHDSETDVRKQNTFINILNNYNLTVGKHSQVILKTLQKETKKSISVKQENIKNVYDIARHFNIFGKYKSLDEMAPSARAHIKIKAKKYGFNPDLTVRRIQMKLDKYGLEAK